jgi:hypothetical protein
MSEVCGVSVAVKVSVMVEQRSCRAQAVNAMLWAVSMVESLN